MSNEDVLEAIERFTGLYGFPPTQREIGEMCGVSERAVRKRLAKLEETGEVTWEPKKKRTVRRADMKGKSIPMS
jgi:Mn-dependent DtxR family transcriptional regulator